MKMVDSTQAMGSNVVDCGSGGARFSTLQSIELFKVHEIT